jgi:hypothetical protein
MKATMLWHHNHTCGIGSVFTSLTLLLYKNYRNNVTLHTQFISTYVMCIN